MKDSILFGLACGLVITLGSLLLFGAGSYLLAVFVISSAAVTVLDKLKVAG